MGRYNGMTEKRAGNGEVATVAPAKRGRKPKIEIPNLHEERASRSEAGPLRAEVSIRPPNMQIAQFRIIGTAPYMQARFSQKAMLAMQSKHEQGSRSKKGKAREARNFKDDYQNAMHKSADGWVGIPAGAFRNAMISACRLCGFKMTLGKLSIFVIADGLDVVDGTPLVKINGKPEMSLMPVRNATGVCDIRARPLWREWSATVSVRYDADQLSLEDTTNLLARVGVQVGIGEGRPDSKESAGIGYGLFDIEGKK